jgi:hypothetical protein
MMAEYDGGKLEREIGDRKSKIEIKNTGIA